MRTSKIYLALLFVAIACSDQPSLPKLTPVELSNDSDFIALMQINNTINQKFMAAFETLDSSKVEKIKYLNNSVYEGENYSELVSLMGYDDKRDFESINQRYFTTLQLLKSRYIQLNNSENRGIFTDALKIYYRAIPNENNIMPKNLGNGRVALLGCPNATACIRQASDCINEAESDFAGASLECAAGGWFIPPAWAYCQGTAFLLKAADMADCNAALSACCGIKIR